MIKSFKTFWKDLYELNKDSWIWMKKHWKGYFILIAATLGGEYLWFYKKDKMHMSLSLLKIVSASCSMMLK